jgi:hypothetical protein
MVNDKKPSETPQTLSPGWLRRFAMMVPAVGIACYLGGAGFMAGSLLMMIGSYGRIARSDATPRPEEIAAGIANASLYRSIGVPLALVGAAIAIPSGIAWFLTRRPRESCEEANQR